MIIVFWRGRRKKLKINDWVISSPFTVVSIFNILYSILCLLFIYYAFWTMHDANNKLNILRRCVCVSSSLITSLNDIARHTKCVCRSLSFSSLPSSSPPSLSITWPLAPLPFCLFRSSSHAFNWISRSRWISAVQFHFADTFEFARIIAACVKRMQQCTLHELYYAERCVERVLRACPIYALQNSHIYGQSAWFTSIP